jgi:hypothetical protein
MRWKPIVRPEPTSTVHAREMARVGWIDSQSWLEAWKPDCVDRSNYKIWYQLVHSSTRHR